MRQESIDQSENDLFIKAQESRLRVEHSKVSEKLQKRGLIERAFQSHELITSLDPTRFTVGYYNEGKFIEGLTIVFDHETHALVSRTVKIPRKPERKIDGEGFIKEKDHNVVADAVNRLKGLRKRELPNLSNDLQYIEKPEEHQPRDKAGSIQETCDRIKLLSDCREFEVLKAYLSEEAAVERLKEHEHPRVVLMNETPRGQAIPILQGVYLRLHYTKTRMRAISIPDASGGLSETFEASGIRFYETYATPDENDVTYVSLTGEKI